MYCIALNYFVGGLLAHRRWISAMAWFSLSVHIPLCADMFMVRFSLFAHNNISHFYLQQSFYWVVMYLRTWHKPSINVRPAAAQSQRHRPNKTGKIRVHSIQLAILIVLLLLSLLLDIIWYTWVFNDQTYGGFLRALHVTIARVWLSKTKWPRLYLLKWCFYGFLFETLWVELNRWHKFTTNALNEHCRPTFMRFIYASVILFRRGFFLPSIAGIVISWNWII